MPYSEKKEIMQRHYQKSHISFIEDIENGNIDLYGYVLDLERARIDQNKHQSVKLRGKNKKLYVSHVDFNTIHRQYAKHRGMKESKIASMEELFAYKSSVVELHKIKLMGEKKRSHNLVEIPKRYLPVEEDKSFFDMKYFQHKLTNMLNHIPHGIMQDKDDAAYECSKILTGLFTGAF